MVDWTTTKRKHGTTSGYNLHRALDEEACEPCRAAQRKVSAKNRKNATKSQYKRNLLKSRAQSYAKTDLANRYKEEYDELYRYYLNKLGVG